ncbi:MAG: MFS transporter [Cucumibacter sp.]
MNRATPIILAVALFMENMDATVIATSLPAIAEAIGASPVALKLALTAYLVALAIFIPISGWMADRLGAKNVFRAAIVVFMLGSVACAFSGSLEAFVVSRFLQGVGGAMMTPVARLILFRTTARNQLVSAMAWLTIPALTGPLIGPPFGGFLTTYFGWQWIFFINLPIGALGIAAISRFLPEIEPLPLRPIDWLGFLLTGTAFAGVVFGLSVVSLPALPPVVGILTAVVGVVAGLAYLAHARRAKYPILDLKLFANPAFRASIVGTSVFILGVGAIPFLLPLTLQLAFGMTPFESGLITFVGAGGALFAKFFARRIYAAAGFRSVLTITAIASAAGVAANGFFAPDWPIWAIMAVILAGGLVRSTFFTGVNALTLADVGPEEVGHATAIMSVCRPIATALAVALAGSILEVTALVNGEELSLGDFQMAFFVVAAVSAFSLLPFLRLKPDAGSEVSGHHPGLDDGRDPAPGK